MFGLTVSPHRPSNDPPPPPPLPNDWKEATDQGKELVKEIAALLAKMKGDKGDALEKDIAEIVTRSEQLQTLLSEEPLSTLPASERDAVEGYLQDFKVNFVGLAGGPSWDEGMYQAALNDLSHVVGWMEQVAKEHPSK